MTMQVNQERCNGCGDCVSICPCNAIRLEGGRAVIDEVLCVGCQVCMNACAQDAIAFVEVQSSLVQRTALATPQMGVLPAWPTPTRNKETVLNALAFAAGAFALSDPGQQMLLHDEIVKPERRICFTGERASLYHAWVQGAFESGLQSATAIHTLETRALPLIPARIRR